MACSSGAPSGLILAGWVFCRSKPTTNHRTRSAITLMCDKLAWYFTRLLVHYRTKDEEELPSSESATRHQPRPQVGASTHNDDGSCLLSVFCPPPANTPVHPQKIQLKSFIKKTLPITPMGSRFCAPFRVSLSKRGFYEVGEGGTSYRVTSQNGKDQLYAIRRARMRMTALSMTWITSPASSGVRFSRSRRRALSALNHVGFRYSSLGGTNLSTSHKCACTGTTDRCGLIRLRLEW